MVRSFDDPNDQIGSFQQLFCEILDKHVPLRKDYNCDKLIPYLFMEWNIARMKRNQCLNKVPFLIINGKKQKNKMGTEWLAYKEAKKKALKNEICCPSLQKHQ